MMHRTISVRQDEGRTASTRVMEFQAAARLPVSTAAMALA